MSEKVAALVGTENGAASHRRRVVIDEIWVFVDELPREFLPDWLRYRADGGVDKENGRDEHQQQSLRFSGSI